jgi:MYXO-CTERM domain-containing protein
MRKGLLAIGIVLWSVTASRVEASVVVLSSKLFNGSGHFIRQQDPPPTTVDSAPTTYTELPFPSNATNSIVNDGTNLNFKAGQSGVHTWTVGNIFRPNEQWTIKKFELAFQIDQPGTYQLGWSGGSAASATPIPIKLVGNDNPLNKSFNTWGAMAPTTALAAGTYTLSSIIGDETSDFEAGFGLQTGSHMFNWDLSLTFNVTSTPEPGGVGLVALCAFVAARRRSKTRA